jgi:hypothetical protein
MIPSPQCPAWDVQLGTDGFDVATGIAAAADGGVIVAGYTPGALDEAIEPQGQTDMFLVKIGATGTREWTRQFGTGPVEFGTAVDTDGAGNVYLAGHSGGLVNTTGAAAFDVAVLAYDGGGQSRWSTQLGTARNDYAMGVVAGRGGAIYVAGYTAGDLSGANGGASLGSWDGWVARLTADGTVDWVEQFGSAEADLVSAIALDEAGDVYVMGHTEGVVETSASAAGGWDVFVQKLDPDGETEWTRQWGSEQDDLGRGISVRGDVVAAVGGTRGTLGEVSRGGEDMFVARFSLTGEHAWTRQLGTEGDDSASAVAIDERGLILVSGRVDGALAESGSEGGWDIAVASVDGAGDVVGVRQHGTTAHDAATSIAVDDAGRVYVTGTTLGDLAGVDEGADAGEDVFVSRVCAPTEALAAASDPMLPPPTDPRPRFRMPTRVHVGTSELGEAELREILDEVNRIWHLQSDICFEFEVVDHDERMDHGFDVRLLPGTGPANGQWPGDDHEIWVRDHVEIGDDLLPARHATARTMAHELGHGLGVFHSNEVPWGPERDTTLMRQFRSGWRLATGDEVPYDQVERARTEAALMVDEDPPGTECAPPVISAVLP